MDVEDFFALNALNTEMTILIVRMAFSVVEGVSMVLLGSLMPILADISLPI